MRFVYVALCILVCTGGSVGKNGKPTGRHFTLSHAQKIHPGKSTKKDVLALLGEPDSRTDLNQATPMKQNSEAWSYLEEPLLAEDRVTVEFPHDSDVVKAVGWNVRAGEPELALKIAKALFAGGEFKKQKMPDINPHVGQTRFFYKELKLGVLIIHNERNNQVESIAWMQPEEVVRRTAYENFHYPDFCMQGHCVRSSPEIERQLAGEK